MDREAEEADILLMYERALDLTGEGDRISKVKDRKGGGAGIEEMA